MLRSSSTVSLKDWRERQPFSRHWCLVRRMAYESLSTALMDPLWAEIASFGCLLSWAAYYFQCEQVHLRKSPLTSSLSYQQRSICKGQRRGYLSYPKVDRWNFALDTSIPCHGLSSNPGRKVEANILMVHGSESLSWKCNKKAKSKGDHWCPLPACLLSGWGGVNFLHRIWCCVLHLWLKQCW